MKSQLKKRISIVFGAILAAFVAFHIAGYLCNERNNAIAKRQYVGLCKKYPNIDVGQKNIWNRIRREMKNDKNTSNLSFTSRLDAIDRLWPHPVERSDRLFYDKIDVLQYGKNVISINDIVFLERYYLIGILRPPFTVHSCFSEYKNVYQAFLIAH